jgi:hypothetical protein
MEDDDRLDAVIKATAVRKVFYPSNFEWTISFLTERYLTDSDKVLFREFQRRVAEQYYVNLAVVAGGWGCTKLICKLDHSSPEAAAQFILALFKDRSITLPDELQIEIARLHNPPVQLDLTTGQITNRELLSVPEIINQNIPTTILRGVQESQTVVGSDSVSQEEDHVESALTYDEIFDIIQSQLQTFLSTSELAESERQIVIESTRRLACQILNSADSDDIYNVDFKAFQFLVKAVKPKFSGIYEINRRIRRVYKEIRDSYSLARGVRSAQRMVLMQKLNALPPQLLGTLVFAVNPPSGIIPPMPAPQGDRTSALLEWAEGPCGCGLSVVQELLDKIVNAS